MITAGKKAMDASHSGMVDCLLKTVRPVQSKMLNALDQLSEIQMQMSQKTVSDARESASQTATHNTDADAASWHRHKRWQRLLRRVT